MALYESFQKVVNSLGMKELTHPVFYNSPIGIRFNIGENNNAVYINESDDKYSVNPNYVSSCLERSLNIYNRLKKTPDLLVIESFLWEDETIDGLVSLVSSVTGLSQPDEIYNEIIDYEQEEYVHVFLMWSLNDFTPNKLLEEIIKADLGSGNHFLTSSVYFICTKDNVLFHLYDNRGADLVSGKKEKSQHIYYELNDLILDYDIEKIDETFKTTERDTTLTPYT